MRAKINKFLSKCRSDSSGCWFWGGATNGKYGVFSHGGYREYAHRFSHIIFWGAIRPGFDVHHECNKPNCVNPEHLRQVTRRENVLLSGSPSAICAKKTHCPKGHPYYGDNLEIDSNGARRCKICRRDASRRFSLKAKRNREPKPKKTDCKNGHKLAGKNLYITPQGYRQCRECNKIRERGYRRHKREKT